jgi:2-hydroxychromene-2-carboxylate isomerase
VIKFYFDFLSPYAYLAWTQIHPLAAKYNRKVEPTPILFAALLDKWGHKGPAEIPPKRTYIFKDVLRTAMVLGVKASPPPAHPFNPLLALRCCALLDDLDERKRAVDALYTEVWGGGRGVTDPEVVASALGVNGASLVQRASSDEAKQRVRDNTDGAIKAGVFGVPTMIVDGELFWGYDSFGHLERFLKGEDPVRGVDFAQWKDLPTQSVRPGSKS